MCDDDDQDDDDNLDEEKICQAELVRTLQAAQAQGFDLEWDYAVIKYEEHGKGEGDYFRKQYTWQETTDIETTLVLATWGKTDM